MGIRVKKVNMVIREAVKAIKKKGIKANDIRRENMGPSSFSLEARATSHTRGRTINNSVQSCKAVRLKEGKRRLPIVGVSEMVLSERSV